MTEKAYDGISYATCMNELTWNIGLSLEKYFEHICKSVFFIVLLLFSCDYNTSILCENAQKPYFTNFFTKNFAQNIERITRKVNL